MPGFLQEHLRPLAGAAALHLGLVGLLALAALKWTASQPPVEIAIQGYVAELPPNQGKASKPRSSPPPAPRVEAPPEPVPEPKQERRAEERVAAERAAEAARERRQVEERAVQEREAQVAREQAAAEQRRAEAAQRKRAAEADAKRKAAEDAERSKAEVAEARRKADEKARAERDARADAEREAELQRSLAEEEASAVARSGVMDEYRRLLVQTIERNWIRPPSARPGLECTLNVTQAHGGTVVDVRLGACNGDQAVRESITTAVFKSSPLPAPRDARAFERRLEIVFKPTE